ncbi:hypothetical protein [Lactococcus lactis]|uniref:hypothetical protein n=1 Tax=Lactococcus lactis TaxID=1358 RepID=UPI00072B7756|nr:hypothetical protein [Lactococcus lactis]KST83045.1 Universal stress protein family [Lactococcus lactis subsp. lactis]
MKEIYKKILVPIYSSEQAINALPEVIAVEVFILNVKYETNLRGTTTALVISLEEI